MTGKLIADCAWEAHSLRLVIAIDNFIYFANCRLDYKVKQTKERERRIVSNAQYHLVVLYSRYSGLFVLYMYKTGTYCRFLEYENKRSRKKLFFPKKSERNLQVHYRYVRNLLTIGGYGSYCCIGALVERNVSAAAPMTDTYVVLLCNSIGVTIESKYIPFQPVHICVTQSYAIIAAKSLVFIWGISGFTGSQMTKKQPYEKFVQIDDPAVVRHGDELQLSMMANIDGMVKRCEFEETELRKGKLRFSRKLMIRLRAYVGRINGSLWRDYQVWSFVIHYLSAV